MIASSSGSADLGRMTAPVPSGHSGLNREGQLMAVSVSSRPRQVAVFRRDGPAGQGQLSATIGNSR
jgi:hypothetical protein